MDAGRIDPPISLELGDGEDRFSAGIAGVYDGDGREDLVILDSRASKFYVYHGSPTGIRTAPTAVIDL